jgi:hypothetical protein
MYRATVVFVTAFVAFTLTTAQAQGAQFDRQQYRAPQMGDVFARADINTDGISDLVLRSWSGTYSASDGLYVMLGSGTGAFHQTQHLASAQLITGAVIDDFNGDGKADLVFGTPAGLHFAAGHGDGTFASPVLISGTAFPADVTAADFNGDGKVDLAFGQGNQLKIALGQGNGTFAASKLLFTGPTEQSYFPNVVIGDFDGDGKADIAAAEEDGYDPAVGYFTKTVVLYGSGTGTFTEKSITVGGSARYVVADINGDGRSDLVGIYVISYKDPTGDGVHVLYGSGARTMRLVTLGSKDLGVEYSEKNPVAVADLNGDGRMDIAFAVNDVRDQYTKIAFIYQQPDGSLSLSSDMVAIAPLASDDLFSVVAGRYTDDGMPDLVTMQNSGTLDSLVNISSGRFPTCSAPGRGVHVCSPASGASATSPVKFNVAATNFAPIRKIEVWVDGTKRVEKFFSVGTNAYLNSAVSLASGSHTATVFSAGFDNRLQRTSFSFSVASSTQCSAPSSATGTVICSPANGSTASSPVSVQANGGSSVKNMEAWVDGVRKYAGTGNTFSLSLSLPAGSHKLTVFSKNGSMVLSSAVTNFTIR